MTQKHICIFTILLLALVGMMKTASAEQTNWQTLNPLVQELPALNSVKSKNISNNPVVVTFFASWCPPCTDEFKEINQFLNSPSGQDIDVFGINLFENISGFESETRLSQFIEKTEPQFPLFKGNKQIGKAFGNISRIPTVIVYGRDGREIWRFVHEQGSKVTHARALDLEQALAGK